VKELEAWIAAAESIRATCENLAAFDALIAENLMGLEIEKVRACFPRQGTGRAPLASEA
jgi:hypothetical protein